MAWLFDDVAGGSVLFVPDGAAAPCDVVDGGGLLGAVAEESCAGAVPLTPDPFALDRDVLAVPLDGEAPVAVAEDPLAPLLELDDVEEGP